MTNSAHPTDSSSTRRRKLPMAYLYCLMAILVAGFFALMLYGLHCPPWRANEGTAISGLKNYNTAQVTFSVGKQATVPGNTPRAWARGPMPTISAICTMG